MHYGNIHFFPLDDLSHRVGNVETLLVFYDDADCLLCRSSSRGSEVTGTKLW